MSVRDLTPTEALLSCAAAETAQELHAARQALIATGARMLDDLDRSALVSGDGTAGAYLLAGPKASCARRSERLVVRLAARAARPGTGAEL